MPITPKDFCILSPHEKEEKRKPIIDEVVLERFLTQEGFRCIYDEATQGDMKMVRVVDKRIRKSCTNELYRYLVDILENNHRQWLLPLKSYRVLLYDPTVKQMLRIEPNVLRDTPTSSYIPFDNGIVEVTSESITLRRYDEILLGDTCILNDQIIHKNIDLNCGDFKDGSWYKFCENAVGSDGISHLMRSLGFMLHTYKDKANSKMVIFADASESEFHEANGGSGKSCMAYDSLNEVRNCHWIDGKDFDPKSQFKFQGVLPEHEIICLDDIPKGFRQAVIYNKTTGNFGIEAKYKASKTLAFKDSGKFIITGNYGLVMEGESDKRRSCVIGFTNHYSSTNRPIDEFKHRFFDGWTGKLAIEYQYFYNFMASCIQQYLLFGMESYRQEDVVRNGVTNNYPKGIIEAIQSAKHKLIGSENAMLQKSWISVIGRSEPNVLEALRKVMDSDGYVIDTSVRKKINKSDANASQLYFWRKK